MFKKNNEDGVFKSVVTAYFILAFHVILIASIGCLVLFFRGIIQYMVWIFIAGSSLIAYSGYRFIKRMRDEKKTLNEMLNSSVFSGRSVELSFLGGFASFKLGKPEYMKAVGCDSHLPVLQLEDPVTMRMRELSRLASLFEKGLITLNEYNQMKGDIFNASPIIECHRNYDRNQY